MSPIMSLTLGCGHLSTNSKYLHGLCLIYRYYKNSVDQKPGWNADIFKWCKAEAERQQIKEKDYWGGLVLDEMKLQVYKY